MNAPVSISDVSGVREALSILGLETDVRGDVDASTLKAAFRKAVKAERPDQAGGDAERFRRVIAAYRLIQAHQPPRPALSAPAARPAPAPVLVLSPMQALAGGQVEVRLGARTVQVTAPKGLRSGDHLRLRRGAADGSDLYLSVLIRPEDGLSVVGDDLFMTWAVERRLMADGGRVEIETPVGTRSAWITADMAAPVRVRLKDLGLPARGSRPAGHLFVTLEPSSDAPSAAEGLLVRFTRVWTQERLAA
ncbi:MAG: DnaJ C-terminal domain-containing protein [Brevundimonas sp.]|jgi:curved DNA-binding protein